MSDVDLIDCPNCGVELDLDASIHYGDLGYCPKCGEYFDPEDERNTDAEDGDGGCAECGADAADGSEFCSTCIELFS